MFTCCRLEIFMRKPSWLLSLWGISHRCLMLTLSLRRTWSVLRWREWRKQVLLKRVSADVLSSWFIFYGYCIFKYTLIYQHLSVTKMKSIIFHWLKLGYFYHMNFKTEILIFNTFLIEFYGWKKLHNLLIFGRIKLTFHWWFFCIS